MSMVLDGIDVLIRIAKNAKIFPVLTDVNEFAQKIVVKTLKAKTLSHDDLKAIFEALGDVNFRGVADELSPADLKSIVGRVDKHNPEVKNGDENSRRLALIELASGRAGLSEPPPKKVAAKKPKAALKSEADSITSALGSKAMQATRKRKAV